jgi:hypothetical protein
MAVRRNSTSPSSRGADAPPLSTIAPLSLQYQSKLAILSTTINIIRKQKNFNLLSAAFHPSVDL